MKKSITLMITLGLGWTLHAQTGRESRLNEQPQLLQKTEAGFSSLGFTGMPAVIAEKSNHHSLPGTLSSGIKIRPLGQEPNALGTISNRQYLWADPSINTVSLAHRDTGRGSNSGFLYYDISKDMGKTWNNNKGPVYTPDASPQSVYFNARYPQSLIYNPAGNTKADSAYEVYFAPSLDNTNPSTSVTWGGHVYGVHQLSGLHAPTQHAIQSSAASDTWNYIPTSMFITKQGTVYNLDPNSPGTAGFDMNDSVILSKGTFNPASRDLNFTVSKVRIPEALTNKGKHMYYESKITFADDGMTGYISAIEKLDYASPDSSLGLVVYKTTDGGGTWAAPVKLDVNAADIFLLNAKGRYTTGFEHGAVVDGSGNLHLLVNVNLFDSAQRYSFYLLPPYIQKEIGLFDIYTKDGGITWYEKLITHPMTFGGIYGSGSNTSSQIFEFNRLHASRTYTGGKQLFFTWFDTDTTLSQRNIMPDMYSMGYDETTNKWTTVRNFTQGTAADGSVRQGMVSYYVFNNANSYTIPCAYVGFPSNDTSQTLVTEQLNYIDSAQFFNVDFIVPDNSVPLALGIQEHRVPSLFVSQNYPNPCTDLTNIDIGLTEGSPVTLSLFNTLGQLISTSRYFLSPGMHTLSLNCTGITPGIYFYSVGTNTTTMTKRLIIH